MDLNATLTSDQTSDSQLGPHANSCAFWNKILPEIEKNLRKSSHRRQSHWKNRQNPNQLDRMGRMKSNTKQALPTCNTNIRTQPLMPYYDSRSCCDGQLTNNNNVLHSKSSRSFIDRISIDEDDYSESGVLSLPTY
jgi:hypothetical protein